MTDLIFENRDDVIRVGKTINRLVGDDVAFIDVHEDGMAPGQYSLRIWTVGRYLAPEVMGPLADHGFALEYLGDHDDKPLHVWLLDGMAPGEAVELTGRFMVEA